MFDKNKLKLRILYIILFILVFNGLAMFYHWYSLVWYLDIFMHFLGGFLIGLFYFTFIPFRNVKKIDISLLILFVLFIGIGWEVFEHLLDKFITFNNFNYIDTFSDILFDTLGGLLAYLYFRKRVFINTTNRL